MKKITREIRKRENKRPFLSDDERGGRLKVLVFWDKKIFKDCTQDRAIKYSFGIRHPEKRKSFYR